MLYLWPMRHRITEIWNERPLFVILCLAFLARLLSVIFSKGYGMHDDHFLVIEAAQSWVDGFDYNNWLPANSINGRPSGHSFFYVGIHYALFRMMEFVGLYDPQWKLFFVRLIHALLSLFTVYFGYRITEKIAGRKDAKTVGLLLALLWFLPILSVRNIVELVCVPFVLASFWMLYREKNGYVPFILAGIFMGFAMGIRVQTYLFFGGMGLVLLFRRQWPEAIVFGLSSILALFLTQITDLFLWGRPFAEMMEYVLYNSTHYDDYITQAWFQYFLLLSGLLIPPVSLMLWFGYFRNCRKHLLLFLPAFIFLLFHSFYPNKQERFILPVVPFIVILGVTGWYAYESRSGWWARHEKWKRGIMKWFWSLNLAALLFISPAYTKKSRVEAMTFMRGIGDVSGILLERSGEYGCYMMPRFYMDEWKNHHICFSKEEEAKMTPEALDAVIRAKNLNYCLFIEETDLEPRLERMKKLYPHMEFIAKFEPSYIDQLLHFLNPRNKNENILLYRLFIGQEEKV